MDIDKITIKFRANKKGTATIAYCDEVTDIQGIGPTEEEATRNFWRAFNARESNMEHQETVKKKEMKKAA